LIARLKGHVDLGLLTIAEDRQANRVADLALVEAATQTGDTVDRSAIDREDDIPRRPPRTG
jgi:hypothetical protein